jgi:hypothetical protein
MFFIDLYDYIIVGALNEFIMNVFSTKNAILSGILSAPEYVLN